MRTRARFARAMLVATMFLAGAALAADGEQVKVKSLRGDTPIDKTPESQIAKSERESPPIPREWKQQPPLIPHSIRNYNITANFNKCMDCHSKTRYKETGATKVSDSHFRDAAGKELANISPRRYFCTQCHVPQTDAAPLVTNTFQPARELAVRP